MPIDGLIRQLGPRLKQAFRGNRCVYMPSVPSSVSPLLAQALAGSHNTCVLHVSDSAHSLDTSHRDIYSMFSGICRPPLYYPARLQSGGMENTDPDTTGFRMDTLRRLLGSDTGNPVITTCIQALMQKTLSPALLQKHLFIFSIDQELELEKTEKQLAAEGYEFTPRVTKKNEACIRGGIMDIWPTTEDWPVRIELLGTQIESMRYFDPVTQRSVSGLETACIMPTGETSFAAQNNRNATLLSFLPEDTIIVWAEYESIREYAEMYEQTMFNKDTAEHILPFDNLAHAINRKKHFRQVIIGSDTKATASTDISGFTHPQIKPGPDGILETLDKNSHVLLYFHTKGALEHFRKKHSSRFKRYFKKLELYEGVLSGGFFYGPLDYKIISEADLYGHRKILDQSYHPYPSESMAPRYSGPRLTDLANLEPGDLVVHAEYGLGKYMGLFEISFNGTLQEALTIEYANNAKLHVPLAQSHLLTRYIGSARRNVRLHRIGGKRWKNEKEEAGLAIKDLAASLLETQAERDLLQGHAFKADTAWQAEFEASFPYHETVDQHRVIDEIKADMEDTRPMDRLVCGDAGYGKTEAAMRAAFKAVMDEKQVAVLVPTTVLALQHFETFNDRMAAYPVRTEMLSRFCTAKQRERIQEGLADGTVDIVIGTHALLQPGICFEKLGLVITDEEQRFGVAHKEHLKHLRKLVDVLTLSATPIPRTLYLSMTGARDISLLQTPPRERMSIETIVTKSSDKIIRDAVLREINRKGQSFYLHNRVNTIGHVRRHLEKILPEARIRIAHGQMPSSQLASIMHDFTEGGFDVLICTTIIESGMDIPNVNTILIDRADRFGLAELYQLRGRVGRSSRQAYAYFLLPPHGKIEAEARQRIIAIKKYSGLGAGFSLALRDLEIRGAGNLLGARQSGHIAAIGFNLYCQLLKQTILRMQGHPLPPVVDVETVLDFIDLSANSLDPEASAVLPYDYIEDESLRVDTYRRFAQVSTIEDVTDLREEVTDRFGAVPPAVKRLFAIAEIRVLCAQQEITRLETRNDRLMMSKGTEFVKINSRFPRLKARTVDKKLEEIKTVVLNRRISNT